MSKDMPKNHDQRYAHAPKKTHTLTRNKNKEERNVQDSQPPSDFQFGSITDKQLANLAKLAGVMTEGDALTPELQEFALLIMEKCAGIGDKYPGRKYTAGDEIRRMFGL